ncbi:hypothetical protein FBU30_010816 [Linnemannia zychae]|nr:hypothetical protein FBU30_010816 [Linnemannia zychae]
MRDELASDGGSSSPYPSKNGRSNFIIVNNDIMIHPGSQPEYQSSDDDDSSFSSDNSYNSGQKSPTALRLPPPVPVNSSQARQARTRPSAPSKSQSSPSGTSSKVLIAPPRKASMEWIPTPLPTPQFRRTQAHDTQVSQQQRSGQQQLRTEKPTGDSFNNSPSAPTSFSNSSPSHSSLQRSPSSSTPQRPPRPTVSPFMSDIPLYSTRTTGPPKQSLQQQTASNTQTVHTGDVEMQERTHTHQKRPSITRTPSIDNNNSYALSTSSPEKDDNHSRNRGERSSSTKHSGSRGADADNMDTGGRTTTVPSSTTVYPNRSRSNSKNTNNSSTNNKSSVSRSSSKRATPANYIDPSTGERQELRGDSTGGGISSFFGGLFGGSSSSKNSKKHPSTTASTTHQQRKRKDASGGLPSSASGSKNNLIDRPHDAHHPLSVEKQSGLAFIQRDPADRKKGLPGKDGREPETDLFNFVDTMLDMPEEPTWSLVMAKLLKVLAVMCVCYYGLMALYFGAEFRSSKYSQNLEILVVDLDNSMIGSNYLNFTKHLNGVEGQPRWVSFNSTVYPNISAVQADVLNGKYWGAVVVQQNASSNLLWSAANINTDYDPTKAFAFIYEGGRDPLVVKPNIVATMYTTFLMFSKAFNPLWIKLAIASFEQQNKSMTAIIDAPQVLGTPIAFEEFDLHPTTAPIITSATSVAYIWIFLVAGGSTYLVANMVQPMTKKLSTAKTMFAMLTPLLGFLIALSLCYSLLLLTFGVPFAGGVSQFFSLFGGMLMLQCSVASMVLFLIYMIPVVFIPGFTITFVILNIIAVFNSVELMPTFYRWVYAMPFLNAVQIARYVLMGSYNRLRYNIPILGVWILIPIIMMPFAISRQKRIARTLTCAEEEGVQKVKGASSSLHHNRIDRKGSSTTMTTNTDDEDRVVVLESTGTKKK